MKPIKSIPILISFLSPYMKNPELYVKRIVKENTPYKAFKIITEKADTLRKKESTDKYLNLFLPLKSTL